MSDPEKGGPWVSAGFEAWYRAEHPRLVSALTVAAGSLDLGREATDEAFARAFERWDRVQAMESPGAWTYRVALNVLQRIMRRRGGEAKALERAGTLVPVPSPAWNPDVWEAVRSLPDRQRTAVALFYVSDLPQERVAEVMGVAAGTVAATLHTARERLGALLSDGAGGAEGAENA